MSSRLPPELAQRLRRQEQHIERLARALEFVCEMHGTSIDEILVHQSPGVRLGMPSTWAEYEAHCKELASAY